MNGAFWVGFSLCWLILLVVLGIAWHASRNYRSAQHEAAHLDEEYERLFRDDGGAAR